MNGFALGGVAEGFNQFRQTDIQQQNSNNALQLGLGRLKIEQQAQANAQQRFDQQRHDEIANQALKDLLGAVQTLRQQNVPEADIQKKFGGALQMLRDNAKLRGLDPTTSVDIPFNSTLSSSIPLDYSLLIDNASNEYNVPKDQLYRGIKQESGFNKNAYNTKSGASGIAQFTPGTAKDRGVNPWNPESAIPGMASYISSLKQRFGNDGLAWAAYNWGPGNVDRWLKNGADPKQVPKETQQYVQHILGKPIEAFTGQGGTGVLESGNQQTTEMSAQSQQEQPQQQTQQPQYNPNASLDNNSRLLLALSRLPDNAPKGFREALTLKLKEGMSATGGVQKLESMGRNIATSMATGDQPPTFTGLYRVGPYVRDALGDMGINVSKLQLDWEAAKKWQGTINNAQMVRFKGLGVSVINTLDEVKNLSQQLKNSGIPLLNAAKLTSIMQTQGNTPQGQLATKYITAINTLKEEFANLAQGGYAPTESVWNLANKQLNENYGVDQLGSSLSEIRRLIGFRLQAIFNAGPTGVGGENTYAPSTPAPTTQPSANDPLGLR